MGRGQYDPVPLTEGAEVARRLAKQWVHEAGLVPIRHLSLDLGEPVAGWESALFERGVEIVSDDLGRPCVPREVLGDLLREERERLAKIEAESAARDAATVAPVAVGIPALEHGSAMESIKAHDPNYQSVAQEFGRIPPPRFVQEAIEEGERRLAAAQAEAAARKGKDR